MLEGRAVIGETDMLQAMQQYALDLASKALDDYDVTEATDIARFIKQVLTHDKGSSAARVCRITCIELHKVVKLLSPIDVY